MWDMSRLYQTLLIIGDRTPFPKFRAPTLHRRASPHPPFGHPGSSPGQALLPRKSAGEGEGIEETLQHVAGQEQVERLAALLSEIEQARPDGGTDIARSVRHLRRSPRHRAGLLRAGWGRGLGERLPEQRLQRTDNATVRPTNRDLRDEFLRVAERR